METAYDGQGNPYLITSYDATTSGSVVNQIQRAYNGLGQMTQEWQATSGAVNSGTTPSVQYGYSFAPSGTTNHSRLTSITYPNGRVLTYNYATGLADNISRLSSITDGATTLESYDYLGLGTVVRRGHTQTGVDQTFVKLTGESDGAAGDKYIGLDAFGRVIDQRWTTSGGTAADRFGYAYDRDSNRLYKENLVSASNSELYSYDSLNQLSSFQRGTLNGTKTGLTGSATRSQSWDFDALGNFDSQTTDGTTQTRTANKQNEITSISGATTPTYDSNGNLTKDETGRTFTYDAWNRLATVKDSGGTLLATYEWDGQGHRVREIRGSTTTDLYYSDQWQVLEERVGGVAKFSYAWSPVYVDAMIARDRDTDANGTLDERLYAVQDANYNVTALLSTSGTVVERYKYDPFGQVTAYSPDYSTVRGLSSYVWNQGFQGMFYDAVAGLSCQRARWYSPTLGRWVSTDPIGFDGGDVNLYRAMSNNPTAYLDSSGKKIIMVSNASSDGNQSWFLNVPDNYAGTDEDYLKNNYPDLYKDRFEVWPMPINGDRNNKFKLFINGASGDARLEREIVLFLNESLSTHVSANIPIMGRFLPTEDNSAHCIRWTRQLQSNFSDALLKNRLFKPKLKWQMKSLRWPSFLDLDGGPDHSIVTLSYKRNDKIYILGLDDKFAFGNTWPWFDLEAARDGKGYPAEARIDIRDAIREAKDALRNAKD